MNGRDLVRPALRIVALWMLPAVVFSAAYLFVFHASVRGTLAHLSLVAAIAFALLSCLAVIALFIGKNYSRLTARCGLSLTVVWTVFWCWVYALMAVGLLAWGRIPTVSLVMAYSDQVPSLLRVLGVSVVAAYGAAFVAVSVPVLLSCLATRPTWIAFVTGIGGAARDFPNQKYVRFFVPMVAASLLFAAERWYHVALHPASPESDEPVYLALEPVSPHAAQSLIMNRVGDLRRVQVEDASRDAYRALMTRPADGSAMMRNIVLISVDALRPDHLGVYGYARDTTPRLSELKKQGRLWAAPEARSACAESSCGLLSLTTGKQPHELLTKNFGLSEVLGLHGYQRTLLLSGDHTNFYKLRESYGSVDTYIDGTSFVPGAMNDDYALLEQLRQLPPATVGRPQFMFFHLMSVHGLGTKHPEHRLWLPAKTLYGTFSAPVTPEAKQLGKNSYDHGVRQVDWVIGQIVVELTKRSILNAESILLITADHGESLGEHGVKTHAESVYESVIRIPWIWVGAAPPYPKLDTPAIQADFAPTVLAALNLPVPSHWSGLALQTAPSSRRSFHAQPPFAAVIDYAGTARTKLIRDFRAKTTQVFDLAVDPAELSPKASRSDNSSELSAGDALIRHGYGDGQR